MDIQNLVGLIVIVALIIAALSFKPMRKTTGLLLVILGALACMTVVGVVVGIPMIITGGLFLFI